jgi:YebC/PmpR family DNA-binding regulatory protein
MAGHSKFKNIQHRKGAQDKKRAKIFTKLVREILAAAKIGGIDANNNPRLRTSLNTARAHNLPKERIEKALKQAIEPNNNDNYTENRYEGFLPGGIALIVETLTDNKNRTAGEVRSIFTRYGGNLGENGSVSFMFEKVGKIEFAKEAVLEKEFLENAIEKGAEDVALEEDSYIIYTDFNNFNEISEILTSEYGTPINSAIIWRPQNNILIEDEEKARKIVKILEAFEDNDDVQNVFANYQFTKELRAKFCQEE